MHQPTDWTTLRAVKYVATSGLWFNALYLLTQRYRMLYRNREGSLEGFREEISASLLYMLYTNHKPLVPNLKKKELGPTPSLST